MSGAIGAWGPTDIGVLLTGSRKWQLVLGQEAIELARGGQPKLSGHLLEVAGIDVVPGIFYARCKILLLTNESIAVDGIPNARARALARAFDEAATEAICAGLSEDYLARFSAWFDACRERMIAEGAWSDPGLLDELVESPPSPCPDLTLAQVASHPRFAQCAEVYSDALARLLSPRDALRLLQETHDRELFLGKFIAWLGQAVSLATSGGARWWPQSATMRILTQLPPPRHPTLGWISLPVMGACRNAHEVLAHQREQFNAAHLAGERQELADFFATVEKSPLTAEQIDAVVCFDDHELVVAAAGSGKTSTMVAKAGYALKRNYCEPEQILLLAFNAAAAKELDERIKARLGGCEGIDRIVAKTVHAFGKDVIRLATGKTPTLAPWLEHEGEDARQLADIVRCLSEADPAFARQWESFRLVYAKDIGRWDVPDEPEDWDSETGNRGFRTTRGEVVRSKEERTIADWLFYNGLDYRYESPYPYNTADISHRNYLPDFYFPEIDLYYEHFALDIDGRAPKHFAPGYEEGARWKRQLHAAHKTKLIETTSHELRSGIALDKLHRLLTEAGLSPDFNPNRQAIKPQLETLALCRTFRTFQQHVKSNRLAHSQLEAGIRKQAVTGFEARLRLYLDIFRELTTEWERRLQAGGFIDFDDMLNLAGDLLEAGQFKSPFRVVLADEFQDSSASRARLLRNLMRSCEAPSHLCVVGDDWQAVNRFAGADISIMTRFDKWFALPERRMVTQTFRCPKDLCDVSSAFISANPAQIAKVVRTTNARTEPSLRVFAADDTEQLNDLVHDKLRELANEVGAPGGRRPTVMLLNRYRTHGKPPRIDQWKAEFSPWIDISFNTAHKSKGLEADFVFVLNAIEGILGLPCKVEDDPALALAMPETDPFPFAEERRLFYVALTRARRQVWLFTTTSTPSQFLVELHKKGHLGRGEASQWSLPKPCPKCDSGVLSVRYSEYGAFQSCSRFPRCEHSEKLASDHEAARCPGCKTGKIVRRTSKHGPFLGCSQYRDGCRWVQDLGQSKSRHIGGRR